jgi:hypothetical protein
MAIVVEKSRDEVNVTDTKAWRYNLHREDVVAATFTAFPAEGHEEVAICWGHVKPVTVNAEALIKTLESLGYKVTKEA